MNTKTYRKIATLVTTAAIAFGGLVTAQSASAEVTSAPASESYTVADYRDYLLETDAATLQQFDQLDSTDQSKFVELMQDPNFLQAAFNSTGDSLPDGLEIVNSSGESRIAEHSQTPGERVTYLTWAETDMNLFGITMVTLRMEMDYTVSGTSVTAVNRYEAFVVRNINPLTTITLDANSAYPSGGTALHTAVFGYNLGPIEDLSVQIGSIKGQITAQYTGLYTTSWAKV